MKTNFSEHPSFDLAQKHLQVTFTVDEYKKLIDKYSENLYFVGNAKDFGDTQYKIDNTEYEVKYLEKLPDYIIARCPLCNSVYSSILDTHSLYPHTEHRDPDYLFRHEYQEIRCNHFVAVNFFINLNGHLPTEYTYWGSIRGDVPVVMPSLLPDNEEAYVVLHSLPICRIENASFKPKYSMYTLTYFAQNPEVVRRNRLKELEKIVEIDDESEASNFFDGSETRLLNPQFSNLSYWVAENKLFWLDLDSLDLPLASGSTTAFPYENIKGYGKSYSYRQSRFPWSKWLHKEGHVSY